MRIAILTSYPMDVRVGSGVVRSIEGLREGLKHFGLQVDVVHPADYLPTSYKQLAVKRLRFNRSLRGRDWSDYEVIIGSDFDGYDLKLPVSTKYVASNGGLLADIVRFESGETAFILQHLARRECQNVNRAAAVLVPSDYAADQVRHLYKVSAEKIHVMPLAVETEFRNRLLALPAGREGGRQILCVARQYKRKGVNQLLKAFAQVQDKIPYSKLVIVGGGPCAGQNRQLAEKLKISHAVLFLGDINDRQELLQLYAQSDVFCLPSQHETFGIAFLEAMHAGLPIVATAATAVTQLIGNNGRLCRGNDTADLARAIIDLLQDANLSKQQAEAARQKAATYSWQNSANRLLRIIEKLNVE